MITLLIFVAGAVIGMMIAAVLIVITVNNRPFASSDELDDAMRKALAQQNADDEIRRRYESECG